MVSIESWDGRAGRDPRSARLIRVSQHDARLPLSPCPQPTTPHAVARRILSASPCRRRAGLPRPRRSSCSRSCWRCGPSSCSSTRPRRLHAPPCSSARRGAERGDPSRPARPSRVRDQAPTAIRPRATRGSPRTRGIDRAPSSRTRGALRRAPRRRRRRSVSTRPRCSGTRPSVRRPDRPPGVRSFTGRSTRCSPSWSSFAWGSSGCSGRLDVARAARVGRWRMRRGTPAGARVSTTGGMGPNGTKNQPRPSRPPPRPPPQGPGSGTGSLTHLVR